MSDDEKKLKYGNYENHFKPLLIDSLKGAENGCGQIKNYIENAKTAEEPLWWRVLSLANNCVDRDEVIHVISKDHPGYSREETERKATGAPKTCKDFNSINPDICTKCNHWEKISTPIQLHKVATKLQPVEYMEPIEGEVLPSNSKKIDGLPETLDQKGYWLGAKTGGVFKSLTVIEKELHTKKIS